MSPPIAEMAAANPESVEVPAASAALEIHEQFSLADLLRARESGMGVRELAAFFKERSAPFPGDRPEPVRPRAARAQRRRSDCRLPVRRLGRAT